MQIKHNDPTNKTNTTKTIMQMQHNNHNKPNILISNPRTTTETSNNH